MGRHETVSASVVLASAEVNAAIHHLDPDRMIEAEMHRGRNLENEYRDPQRRGMNDFWSDGSIGIERRTGGCPGPRGLCS